MQEVTTYLIRRQQFFELMKTKSGYEVGDEVKVTINGVFKGQGKVTQVSGNENCEVQVTKDGNIKSSFLLISS